MATVELQKRTIFGTRKRENLELKFEQFYQESQKNPKLHSENVGTLVQTAVASMIRNAFYVGDFSYLAKDLMRKVFLEGEVPASVRHLCIYFEDYFSKEEFAVVVSHLYKNEEEYNQLTEEARLHIEHLRPALTSGVQTGERKLVLKAGFLDQNNKMHNWSLANVVSALSAEDSKAILNIFGELTIFQKDGQRQFTKSVWLYFAIDERLSVYDTRKEDDPLYEAKEVPEDLPEEAADEEQSAKTPTSSNETKDDQNNSQSDTNDQSPVKNLDQNNDPTKTKKKKPVKTPTDRMPSWKNLNPFNGKSKKDRNLEIEKAGRNNSGGKKKRKRNKRKK